MMLRYLVLASLTGCIAGSPALGTADWNQQPNNSDDLFTVAWAEQVGQEWHIHTFQFDEEIHCSDRTTGGGLSAELSDISGLTLGDAPITTEPLDPGLPGAHLRLGNIDYTSGSLTINAVNNAISATFVVENTDLGSTASGRFDATICD